MVENYNGKLNLKLSPAQKVNVHYSFSDNVRSARDVGGFVLDFTRRELAHVQAAFDTATVLDYRSNFRNGPFERLQTQLNADANWFRANNVLEVLAPRVLRLGGRVTF